MRNLIAIVCGAAASLVSSAAAAHHGLDFLLVQTAHLPEKGTGYVFARYDYVDADDEEDGDGMGAAHDDDASAGHHGAQGSEIEPAVLYGVADWLAFEAHAHYGREDGDWRYESIAPAVHMRVTPRGQPFSVGVSVEYAFAHGDAHADAFEVTGAFGYAMEKWIMAGNVVYAKPSGHSGDWAYAAGVRRTFRERHGVGLEAQRENGGATELLVGYYGEIADRLTLNAGVGTGVGDGPDATARFGFIWRFR